MAGPFGGRPQRKGRQMNTNQRLQEALSPREGFYAADISTPVDSTVFHSVAGFKEVMAVGEAAADTHTLTLTLLQATDAAGTGAKVLGTAVTKTTTSDVTAQCLASALVEEMDIANDFTFVGVRLGSGEAVSGWALIALGGADYRPVVNTAEGA